MEYTKIKMAAMAAACLALCAPTAHAKLKYEPDSYVQNGLVLQLDGIRNDGASRPHNPAAAEWRNLANGANPLLLVRRDENDGSAWTNGVGYYFAGKSHGITAANLPQMSKFSVEFFGDFPPSRQIADDKCYPTYVSANLGSQNLSILTQSNWSTIYFSAISGTDASLAPQISQSKWNGKSFSYILDAESAAAHVGTGGVYVAKTSARSATEQAKSVPSTKWLVATAGFKADYYNVPETDYTRQARGVCKAMRIYSRALSAEEVAANHALDVIRFETGIPVTNAVVATSVTGAEGTEPCGAYAVDGSHTFSAPGRATVGGTEWFCTGHTLEVWDSASGAWGAPTMSVATRRVVAEGEKVRIT